MSVSDFSNRVFRTVPELDRGESRAGMTFVNILFGLVVTSASVAIASEVVKGPALGWSSIDKTRLAHLAVAMTLTVLSWIGYHQSHQYAPFLIKFLNIPFVQFFLEVTMVVVYYMVVQFAENRDVSKGVAIRPGALSEAVLVLAAFVLYSIWDLVGYMLFHDREYSRRLETPREPDSRIGARRIVTFVFTVLAAATAAVIWLTGPRTTKAVVIADAVIIVLLFAYRICKQAFDPRVKTRIQAPTPPPVVG